MNSWTLTVRLNQVNARIMQQKGDPLGQDIQLLEDAPVNIVDANGRILEAEKVGATADGRVLIVAVPASRWTKAKPYMVGWSAGVVGAVAGILAAWLAR